MSEGVLAGRSGPKSLEEPVIHNGGAALSENTNRILFWAVRALQASLVGEKSKTKEQHVLGPWKKDQKLPKKGREDFPSTNQDPTNMLGMTNDRLDFCLMPDF